MRTSPTECSSTSGVFPIRSRSDGATTLRIPPPDVDRGAQLAQELVDAPGSSRRVGRDAGGTATLDQLLLAPVQARQAQKVLAGIPCCVLDHALAPFAAERCGRHERQSG